MRRVSFKSVRAKAALLFLGNATPDAQAAAALDVHIARRAVECWESFFWPEWTVTEARTFRQPWDAVTTWAAKAEVYHRPSKSYAIALQANTNHEPYTLSGSTYVLNTTYWAALESDYTGDDYLSTRTYVRGEIAFYPATDKWYCLYAATSTGNAPTDATKWGELTRFIRNLDLTQSWASNAIGEIEGIYCDDPRVSLRPDRIDYELTSTGAICDTTQGIVYVKFRLRAPDWSGATYTSGGATVAGGTQVYDDTTGDFYLALATTNAAVTDTNNFTRLDFPYVFRDAVAQLAYADALRGNGMNEKAGPEIGEGFRLLRRELDKIERQQGQHKQLNVRTRR